MSKSITLSHHSIKISVILSPKYIRNNRGSSPISAGTNDGDSIFLRGQEGKWETDLDIWLSISGCNKSPKMILVLFFKIL